MAGRIISMKNSSDTIGNRTRDLPTCSAVPQPTALPRAPKMDTEEVNLKTWTGMVKVKVKQSHKRRGGFQKVAAPKFKDNWHLKVVRLSALRTGRLYPPGNIPGAHFC